MIFEQVINSDLGCASYVIGCQAAGIAVVIDPPLHVAPVLEACARHDARLVGVVETHNHADHVSGHGVLAVGHGAWIAIHELAAPAYAARLLHDREELLVGNIKLTVVHTPGHRPEHCAIAVSDLTRADEPWLLCTGDSLFVGDVARPDLAVGGSEGAEELYHSLHERLAWLDDGVEVFPGHVAGSLCGRGMSAKGSTTLGFERRFNPMLVAMPVADFVRRANADLAPKPPNLARIVDLNRGALDGHEPEALPLDELPADAQLLDVRDGATYAAGHVPGSINAPVAERGFATRAGFALDPGEAVVIRAADAAELRAATQRLAATGFRELRAAPADLAGAESERFTAISLSELRDGASAGRLQVVDVREPDEQTTLAAGAVAVPYRLLLGDALAGLDRERPVAVVCHTGVRAPIAASLLARRGFRDVRPVLGEGMGSWAA